MKKQSIIIIMLLVVICMLFSVVANAEEMKLFEFDVSGEAKVLWGPADNSIKYGFGAEFAYAFDRTLSLGAIWVPGENFDTDAGEGQKALYGPEIGADILKLAKLANIEITFPETFQPRLGVTWLANMEGGIRFEDSPRISLTILSYDF